MLTTPTVLIKGNNILGSLIERVPAKDSVNTGNAYTQKLNFENLPQISRLMLASMSIHVIYFTKMKFL